MMNWLIEFLKLKMKLKIVIFYPMKWKSNLNLNLKKVDFLPTDFLNNWQQATEYNAAPIIYFTNALPLAQVTKLARNNNRKVVLSGEGADELFLGYSKLIAQRYKSALLMPETVLKKLYKV